MNTNKDEFFNKIKSFLEINAHNNHRSLIILSDYENKTINKKSKEYITVLNTLISFISSNQKILHVYKQKPTIIFSTLSSTALIYKTSFKDTDKILGNTFNLLIIEFDKITPNTLLKVMETVSGGGLIIFVIKDYNNLIDSSLFWKRFFNILKELREFVMLDYNFCIQNDDFMPKPVDNAIMQQIKLTLGAKTTCQEKFLKKYISILCKPSVYSGEVFQLSGWNNKSSDLKDWANRTIERKESNENILNLKQCLLKNDCQTKSRKNHRSNKLSNNNVPINKMVFLSSHRGRGKSSSLGILVAHVIFNRTYNVVYLTAPDLNNLQVMFSFAVTALNELFCNSVPYNTEHMTFNKEKNIKISYKNKLITKIEVLNTSFLQIIEYIPLNSLVYNKALSNYSNNRHVNEHLLIIDEAAAIPVSLLKEILNKYTENYTKGHDDTKTRVYYTPDKKTVSDAREGSLIFLSSTISGYEGTGKALTLKVLNSLDTSRVTIVNEVLNESVRYSEGDLLEKWIFEGCLLDTESSSLDTKLSYLKLSPYIHKSKKIYSKKNAPPGYSNDTKKHDTIKTALLNDSDINNSKLYLVNKKLLFSGHTTSDALLKEIYSLFTRSHYKNSPNDLKLIADNENHFLMVLLMKTSENKNNIVNSDGYKIMAAVHLALEKYSNDIINTIGLEDLYGEKTAPYSLIEEKKTNMSSSSQGNLIPNLIVEYYGDYLKQILFDTNERDTKTVFGNMLGNGVLRIVRICVMPGFEGRGFGSRCVSEIKNAFFNVCPPSVTSCSNNIGTKKELCLNLSDYLNGLPSLYDLSDTTSEEFRETIDIELKKHLFVETNKLSTTNISHIGTSLGATVQIINFWIINGFLPIYLKLKPNKLTGEFSCLLVYENEISTILNKLFVEKFVGQLGVSVLFSEMNVEMIYLILSARRTISCENNKKIETTMEFINGISSIGNKYTSTNNTMLCENKLSLFTPYDIHRLKHFKSNFNFISSIIDLLPNIARYYYLGLTNMLLKENEEKILICLGLQRKSELMCLQELKIREEDLNEAVRWVVIKYLKGS
ncbi:RNA cytidine acetyltransferase [Cucumispora dikerogammari]|nr:RNA cytidine acetyltransferase [Cucumispora dikerogammari]